jgi:hypothetical protein
MRFATNPKADPSSADQKEKQKRVMTSLILMDTKGTPNEIVSAWPTYHQANFRRYPEVGKLCPTLTSALFYSARQGFAM